MKENYFKGRGAQIKPQNPFSRTVYTQTHPEGLDEELIQKPYTQIFEDHPQKIVSKNDSPDINMPLSINPYQGCEHGCIYCYARNSHTYWGFDAGLDFETKIMVKKNAPDLLEKTLRSSKWKPAAIVLSGNTDCYQPIERKLQITRQLLKVFRSFRHPVAIITKNALIKRDLDILIDLAAMNLVHVYFSINTLDEKLRYVMEPRTSSSIARLEAMKQLSAQGIPTGVMVAPIIPALNSSDIHPVLKAAGRSGARSAGFTVVRLNGQDAELFKNWLLHHFPDRSEKVWNQIKSLHGGKPNDSNWGRRITGAGPLAESIRQQFRIYRRMTIGNHQLPPLNLELYRKNPTPTLFD
jgi:DNA repair photolyase